MLFEDRYLGGIRLRHLGVMSLVLGISACLFCAMQLPGVWVPHLGVVGIGLGAIGLLMGLASDECGVKAPLAGITLCIIALVVNWATGPASATADSPWQLGSGPGGQTHSGQSEQWKAWQQRNAEHQAAEEKKRELFTAEYLGQCETDYGATELTFRITNETGDAVSLFRGGIDIYDPSGDRIAGLHVQHNEPLSVDGWISESGVWALPTSAYERLAEHGADLRVEFVATRVVYLDGTVETFR